MVIAVCGYNASGKTTIAKGLVDLLENRGFSVQVKRFALLYPGTYLGKTKQKRDPKVSSKGTVGLRSIEGQRGKWNQSLGWSTWANIIAASLSARWMAMLNRKRVVIYDRFLYDRCMHFADSGWRMRLAKYVFFQPSVTLVLLPAIEEHEQRFLERIERRHGITLDRLSSDDRAELAMVHKRYADLETEFSECVPIETSGQDGLERAWNAVAMKLPMTER